MMEQATTRKIIGQMREGLLKTRLPQGQFQDPGTKICDPRPNAEIARGLLVLDDLENAKKAFDWVAKQQQENGSWKEITETETVEENTLSTAIIARALLEGYQITKKVQYLESAKKATKYVVAQEFEPGRYIKSDNHYVDLLNMSATAAALYQKMFEVTKNNELLVIRDRALVHIARHQFKNGALPYTTFERTFPYEEHMNVRDLYYHSLTLWCLLLADKKNTNRHAAFCKKRALRWLVGKIRKRTPWRKSKVIFAVGATGFYAYSAVSLQQFGKDQEVRSCLRHLLKLQKQDGLFNRYEPPFWPDACWGYVKELLEYEKLCPAKYSFATRIMRVRRRVAHDLKQRRKERTSLFYSAQIFSALSEMMIKR